MKIEVIPHNDPKAEFVRTKVSGVLRRHPLILDNVRERLCSLTVQIEIKNDFTPIGVPKELINDTMELKFDPCVYSTTSNELDNVLYHEFSHLIDRWDPNFDINCEKEREAQKIQPHELAGFYLYMHIWNCYIDGRLSHSAKNPRSLDERICELHACTRRQFAPEISGVIQKAWDGKSLRFDDIITLTRECLGFWPVKKRLY